MNRLLWLASILPIFLFSLTTSEASTAPFLLADQTKTINWYVSPEADSLIWWAVNDLVDDIQLMTGQRPNIQAAETIQSSPGVYIGQANGPLAQALNPSLAQQLKHDWEAFALYQHDENLVVMGSDPRGTAYALFEIAERIGISPWKWWADVKVAEQEKVWLSLPANGLRQSPSVQYRGIFLNDEDWGLQPWAEHTFEPEVGDIGPRTYEKIFQLLLRLKANTIWPAMHPSTQAFFQIPGNYEMARKYHIFIGTSHAEPMLRNNVGEWDHDSMGDFNFFTNSEQVTAYWQERIDEVAEAQSDNYIATLGMRGVHDGHMEGGGSIEDKVAKLEEIIGLQRDMLAHTTGRKLTDIPQVLVPYKEVLELYNAGMEVPDDVTLMWTDDNYGYIRRLSDSAEQARRGGSGVYYHLSYWGRPHDYLWLSTTQPGLIWFEMKRAYQNDARKIWIANVGDIKPAEYNMEFFLDLAWDIDMVRADDIHHHLEEWASREFGENVAEAVAEVMSEYYRLAFIRKPEFMGWSQTEPNTKTRASEFNWMEAPQRIIAYSKLVHVTDSLSQYIPTDRKDAWFQLVDYPVKAAEAMNVKFLLYQMSAISHPLFPNLATEYIQEAQQAFSDIDSLTKHYNQVVSSGKWNYMMSASPRGLGAYQFPNYEPQPYDAMTTLPQEDENREKRIFIQGNQFTGSFSPKAFDWQPIQGLGYSDAAVTLFPLTNAYFGGEQPWVEYSFEVPKADSFELQVRCLPTHANNFDHELGIQIDGGEVQAFSLNTQGRSREWKENVLRNSQIVRVKGNFHSPGTHSIRLYVNQTGIVIDQLAVDMSFGSPFYMIPGQ